MEKVFNEQIVNILRENMSTCKFDPQLYEKGETYIVQRTPATKKPIQEVEVPNEKLNPEAPITPSEYAKEPVSPISVGSSNFGSDQYSNAESIKFFFNQPSSHITSTTKVCPIPDASCESINSLKLDISGQSDPEARNLPRVRSTMMDQENSGRLLSKKEISIGDHELKRRHNRLPSIAECGIFDAFNEDCCSGETLKKVIKEVIKEYDGDQSRKTCSCNRRRGGFILWAFPDEPVLAFLDKVLRLFGFGSDVDMEW